MFQFPLVLLVCTSLLGLTAFAYVMNCDDCTTLGDKCKSYTGEVDTKEAFGRECADNDVVWCPDGTGDTYTTALEPTTHADTKSNKTYYVYTPQCKATGGIDKTPHPNGKCKWKLGCKGQSLNTSHAKSIGLGMCLAGIVAGSLMA